MKVFFRAGIYGKAGFSKIIRNPSEISRNRCTGLPKSYQDFSNFIMPVINMFHVSFYWAGLHGQHVGSVTKKSSKI